MKKHLFTIIFLSFIFTNLFSQDSLSIANLSPLTYYFDISKNGILTGDGGDFLKKEFSESQYVMLGEYHNSKRISEFTYSIIPILDSLNFKTLVLEVGPTSGKYLNGIKTNINDSLFTINSKYKIKSGDRVFTPIPFFSNQKDAEFLNISKKLDWQIIGIDQEFVFGIPFLSDKLFFNLSKKEKRKHENFYKKVKDNLNELTVVQDKEGIRFTVLLEKSAIFNKYLAEMNNYEINQPIVESIKESIRIYNLNEQKKWFQNNKDRVSYMKYQLRSQLMENEFDFKNDKLFIKMGGRHTSKGFSPGRFYEIGNTLSELAEFYGNKAINISFSTRFFLDDNEVKQDALKSENQYYINMEDLLQMGKEDKWTIIDLRPLIKGYYYYPTKYVFNETILDLVKRFDFLIIPKIEVDPIPNYK